MNKLFITILFTITISNSCIPQKKITKPKIKTPAYCFKVMDSTRYKRMLNPLPKMAYMPFNCQECPCISRNDSIVIATLINGVYHYDTVVNPLLNK
jgi:hypothetical protein